MPLELLLKELMLTMKLSLVSVRAVTIGEYGMQDIINGLFMLQMMEKAIH